MNIVTFMAGIDQDEAAQHVQPDLLSVQSGK